MPDCAHRDHRDWYEDSRRECYERTRERLRGTPYPGELPPATALAQHRHAVRNALRRHKDRLEWRRIARRTGRTLDAIREWEYFNRPDYLYGAVGDFNTRHADDEFGLTIERRDADGTVTILARILVTEWGDTPPNGRGPYAKRLHATFDVDAPGLEPFEVASGDQPGSVELAQERAWRLLREAGVVT